MLREIDDSCQTYYFCRVMQLNYFINIINICRNKFIYLGPFIKLNSFPVYLILATTVYVCTYISSNISCVITYKI